MSPGAIGARERMPAVEALRPLRVVSMVVLHNTMLQPQISVFFRLQYYTTLYTLPFDCQEVFRTDLVSSNVEKFIYYTHVS